MIESRLKGCGSRWVFLFFGDIKKIKIILLNLKLKTEGRDVTTIRRKLRVQLSKQIRQ